MFQIFIVAFCIFFIVSVNCFIVPNCNKVHVRRKGFAVNLNVGHLDHENLKEHSYKCLDFNKLISFIKQETVTALAEEMLGGLIYHDILIIKEQYSMISQLRKFSDMLPLRSKLNINSLLIKVKDSNLSPTPEVLRQFAAALDEILDVKEFLQENQDDLSLFDEIYNGVCLPSSLTSEFHDAFDSHGELNELKFPSIKMLKSSINSLDARIRSTLLTMLRDEGIQSKVSHFTYTTVKNRYCLSFKNTFKRGHGIVHGVSNTGMV
jgi:dsDNA-specific endonuclease/ATPase MutS2